tara:strand:- start:7428 stop:7820 length:393 start_codon:yes stop_codon:yes gene_type:complete
MSIFTVYENPNPLSSEVIVLIKEGFCWPAFFFSFLWAFYEGLWSLAFLFLVLLICGITFIKIFFINDNLVYLYFVLFNFVYAFLVNDFRRILIYFKGWSSVAIVQGRNLKEAEERFFSFCKFPDFERSNT